MGGGGWGFGEKRFMVFKLRMLIIVLIILLF